MNKKRIITLVTASRAEYGLLKPLYERLSRSGRSDARLVVTGTHLSPRSGMTVREIEADKVPIDARIDMRMGTDTPAGIAASLALAHTAFARYLSRRRPDILVVLGDRYELIPMVSSALIAGIPVAHIHGGEITEGAFDDAIRHAVTKLSHLHFAATRAARQRIIQLGEQPSRVFTVGTLGIDALLQTPFLERAAFEKSIGFRLRPRNLLVTYHPCTLDSKPPRQQFEPILAALEKTEDTGLIFTYANADPGGAAINSMIDAFVRRHPTRAVRFASLGHLRYFSALRYVDGIVGNSSSGILEAPSLHVGTIDIGPRQAGREKAASVIHCQPTVAAVTAAIRKLYTPRFKAVVRAAKNPYGAGMAAQAIVDVLETHSLQSLTVKKFYDLKRNA